MLGKKDMGEFMRMATLPARDMTDEVLDDPILKAMISWDGLVGSKMAPRSPNATVLSLLYRMSGEQGGAHAIPAGGMEGFVNALASAAKDAGVSIKTGSKVEQITMTANEDGLRASGVLLANGEKVSAANIVSSADPKSTFFKMVGVENLEIEFTNRIKRLRCDGYVAKLHLALKGLPKVNGLDQLDGRMIIAPDMDTIEYAYDEAKYGECSEKPVMEVVIPSLHDASAAPAGQHVLSAHMMYVPYELKGGWTEEAKQACYQRAIDTLAVYMPDIREQIIHGELLTPLDLEHNYNVTGGHWHHTEFAADQMLMMRPTYEAAQYKTPIPGLYLCGAGSHPGGDLMGGPGHNAARELLK
jgi:phytoene dehydrogenase-like protein